MFAYQATDSASSSERYSLIPQSIETTEASRRAFVVAALAASGHDRNVPLIVRWLMDMRLTLLQPVPILLSQGPHNSTVTSSILDVYGVGETPAEAMRDWHEEVAHEFFYLAQHENELGGPLLERWRAFRSYITETLFQ